MASNEMDDQTSGPTNRVTGKVDVSAVSSSAPTRIVDQGSAFVSFSDDRTLDLVPGATPVPASIGPYRVDGILGEGGMGIVYRAFDPRLGRAVVIKTVRPQYAGDAQFVERLRREARTMSKVRDEGLCDVKELLEENGRLYIVMEFIDGAPLSTVIDDGLRRLEGRTARRFEALAAAIDARIDQSSASTVTEGSARRLTLGSSDDFRWIAAILRLAARLSRSLHVAHEAGVVHRDLKPGNIMLRKNGHPVVLDFGLAKSFTPGDALLSEPGMVLGTFAYMSPEQGRGEMDVDRRADVYATGAILYEMLADERPFAGRDRLVREDPTPPRRKNPGIPEEVEAIILKAMSFDRGLRYATSLELALDLERYLNGEPITAKPPSSIGKIVKICRRNPVAAAAVVAFAVVAIATAALSIRGAFKKSVVEQRDREIAVLITSISQADRAGEGRPEGTVKRLTELLPSVAIPANLNDPTELNRLWSEFAKLERSAAEPPLREPVGRIDDPAPRFVFDPGPIDKDARYAVRVVGLFDDQDHATIPVDPTIRDADGAVRAAFPGGSMLPTNPRTESSFRWWVEVRGPIDVRSIGGDGATFTLAPREQRAAIVAKLAPAQEPRLDALQRAAAFLAGDFRLDALTELAESNWSKLPESDLVRLSETARADVERARSVLLIKINAALGRWSACDRIAKAAGAPPLAEWAR